jgi:hypothetical protein
MWAIYGKPLSAHCGPGTNGKLIKGQDTNGKLIMGQEPMESSSRDSDQGTHGPQ